MKTKKNNIGFTLAEVTMTMVIVAGLATVALPKLNFVVEKMRAKEGEQYLYTISGAYKRYLIDHDDLDDTTPDDPTYLSDLDVDLSAPSSYFNLPELRGGTNVLAKMERNNGSYTLVMMENGEIQCSSLGGLCEQMGYVLH